MGHRIATTDEGGTTTYAYDPLGRMTGVSRPDGSQISASYDGLGNRISLGYPDQTTASYSYDPNNRLTSVSHPKGGTTTYSYDPDGRELTETLPGAWQRTRGYAAGRLSTYREAHGPGAGLSETILGYDAASRVTTETVNGATTTYSYDPAGQLRRAAKDAAVPLTYTYDAVGDRIGATGPLGAFSATYNTASELVTSTIGGAATTYAYDPAGRLRSQASPTAARVYGYDARGRTRDIVTLSPPAGGAPIADSALFYDADDLPRQVTTTASGQTHLTDLTWDPTGAISQVLTLSKDQSASGLLYGTHRIAAIRQEGPAVFSEDVRQSALPTPQTADLVEANAYDPYGDPLGSLPRPAPHCLEPGSGPQPHCPPSPPGAGDPRGLIGASSPPPSDPRFGYRGELSFAGLVHLRARTYDPSLGRFTTRDPLDGTPGQIGSANPYPYAANDPLTQTDQLGLSPVRDSNLRLPLMGSPNPRPSCRSEQAVLLASRTTAGGRQTPTCDNLSRDDYVSLGGPPGFRFRVWQETSEAISYDFQVSDPWRRIKMENVVRIVDVANGQQRFIDARPRNVARYDGSWNHGSASRAGNNIRAGVVYKISVKFAGNNGPVAGPVLLGIFGNRGQVFGWASVTCRAV